jgi:hypothetical protein
MELSLKRSCRIDQGKERNGMKQEITASILAGGLVFACFYLGGVDVEHRNAILGLAVFLSLMCSLITFFFSRSNI